MSGHPKRNKYLKRVARVVKSPAPPEQSVPSEPSESSAPSAPLEPLALPTQSEPSVQSEPSALLELSAPPELSAPSEPSAPSAPPESSELLLRHVQASRPSFMLTRTVFIVGFMGAGKTSLARRLARRCGCASIDLDRYIERSADCKITQIFQTQGEAAFRDIESFALGEVAAANPAFVACGGGIVEREQNRHILHEAGYTIYLKTSPDEAISRIGNVKSRPLLADMDAARQRAAERAPLYETVADATVDTAGHVPASLARLVCSILRQDGVLVRVTEGEDS